MIAACVLQRVNVRIVYNLKKAEGQRPRFSAFLGKSLTGEMRPCIFFPLQRLKGEDSMIRFTTGRYFYVYCFFSKGLPGAR
jgi:hypothetical protein